MKKTPHVLKQRPFHGTPVKLPETLVAAWRQTLLAMAKLPKHHGPALTPEQRYQIIVRSEVEAVQELWRIFTDERERLSRYLMDAKRQTVAYQLGFHLVNMARLWHGLSAAESRHGWLAASSARTGPLQLIDLGCGTGSMAQALYAFINPQGPTKIELVDKSKAFLTAAADNLKNLNPALEPKLIRSPIEEYREGPNPPSAETLNILSMGYLWNELRKSPHGRQRLLAIAKTYVKRRSILVIVEPATEDIAREAMALRDQLVEIGYQSLYPCPHQQPCPMLARSRDWCYSEVRWLRPQEASTLDRLTGMDRSHCHGAIHIMVSPDTLAGAIMNPAPVIVGRPLEKGTREGAFSYLLCGPEAALSKAVQGKGAIGARGDLQPKT